MGIHWNGLTSHLIFIRRKYPQLVTVRRVWRYQRGNQNLSIEGQTTQWQKEKGQKDKQRFTKHTHKTKDRVTRTPLNTSGELMCSTSNYILTLAFFIANVISNSGVLTTSFGNQLKKKFISDRIQTQDWPLLIE